MFPICKCGLGWIELCAKPVTNARIVARIVCFVNFLANYWMVLGHIQQNIVELPANHFD